VGLRLPDEFSPLGLLAIQNAGGFQELALVAEEDPMILGA
jgi:hypothetical protein